ncbi:hypothetical protein DET49_10243 [Salegentibacter sp. 24]|jgi:hypothetical protein|uniref:DUF3078 domain-containing protein n=1 Tax=Salegentibacter sp. 24 TaxID=2183986 RepID=UPI00105F1C6C|nr:DUF3078 domain-containing protein [Salegentibacter sp. 24]TDN95160.1 hypothetical protein DET49_10243 [Salegentibacter sp. 24]
MKRLVLALALFSGVFNINAQEETEAKKEGWTTEGNISILFNQSAFNEEWTGGGTSNFAGNLLFDYNFNYLKDDFTWNNKVLLDYGLTKQRTDDFSRKTSDRLELNSIAGKQVQESNWFYSLFLNFRTQVTKGYKFGEDPESGQTIRTEYTNFLSPAYLQFGPGMMWKKSDRLYLNIAPATGRMVFGDKDFTSRPDYVDGDYFGLDADKAMRFEFGASVSGYAKIDIIENVTMENMLNLYSNYLENPKNVDLDYTMNMNMKINDYLSTNLIFQAIYDDNAVQGFQIREVFGIGFNYGF